MAYFMERSPIKMVNHSVGVSFIVGVSNGAFFVLHIRVKVVVCRTPIVLQCLHLHHVLAIDEHHVLTVPPTGTTHPAMHPKIYGPIKFGDIQPSPVTSCSVNNVCYDREVPLPF